MYVYHVVYSLTFDSQANFDVLTSDLIAQFISRKTNLRTDSYSAPLALLRNIIHAIRATVPQSDFIVGIKLNSADYATGGFSPKDQDGRAHLAEIASWAWNGAGVDFIEISGGDYESPGTRSICIYSLYLHPDICWLI